MGKICCVPFVIYIDKEEMEKNQDALNHGSLSFAKRKKKSKWLFPVAQGCA
jgi:hypothetical protein